ncbi:hypothetical protein D3C78_1882360 [compost metagenome]
MRTPDREERRWRPGDALLPDMPGSRSGQAVPEENRIVISSMVDPGQEFGSGAGSPKRKVYKDSEVNP